MSRFVRVYETVLYGARDEDIGGLYEQIDETEEGPVYQKVSAGKPMYFYIHDTGGSQYGFWVLAQEFKPKSNVAHGELGFPYGCADRLKLNWNSRSRTPPTISALGPGRVIAFDYDNGCLFNFTVISNKKV